jgi:hypothetical protein
METYVIYYGWAPLKTLKSFVIKSTEQQKLSFFIRTLKWGAKTNKWLLLEEVAISLDEFFSLLSKECTVENRMTIELILMTLNNIDGGLSIFFKKYFSLECL